MNRIIRATRFLIEWARETWWHGRVYEAKKQFTWSWSLALGLFKTKRRGYGTTLRMECYHILRRFGRGVKMSIPKRAGIESHWIYFRDREAKTDEERAYWKARWLEFCSRPLLEKWERWEKWQTSLPRCIWLCLTFWPWTVLSRVWHQLTGRCGNGCGYVAPYGFVPEAGCPVHDCNGR